jgi:hypothetical protein
MKRVDLTRLETELKEHDWTYEMSDDHSYWTSGTNQRSLIRALITNLYERGLGKKVEVLFYKHYPVKGCHEVKGYGIQKTWAEHLDRTAMEFVPDANDKHLIMKKGIVR